MVLDIALALSMLESPEQEDRFNKLVAYYQKLMFYIARKYTSDPGDLEDIVQEACLALAKNFHKISDIQCHETKSYVVTVVESKAINYYHKGRRRPETVPLEDVYGVEVEYEGDDTLSRCILKLPARYREFILLKYSHGLDNKELAEVFQLSGAGVRKLDQRAKAKLEELCREEGLL